MLGRFFSQGSFHKRQSHAAGNYVIVNQIHSIYYFCSFKQGAHEVRDFSLLVFADRLNHVRDQVLRDFS